MCKWLQLIKSGNRKLSANTLDEESFLSMNFCEEEKNRLLRGQLEYIYTYCICIYIIKRQIFDVKDTEESEKEEGNDRKMYVVTKGKYAA